MIPHRRITRVVLCSLLLGAVTFLRPRPGIVVTVANHSASPVTNLVLTFNGGSNHFPMLSASSHLTTIVNPVGSSRLFAEYLDMAGNRHASTVDVYFEHNYRGHIALTIETNASLAWQVVDIALPYWHFRGAHK